MAQISRSPPAELTALVSQTLPKGHASLPRGVALKISQGVFANDGHLGDYHWGERLGPEGSSPRSSGSCLCAKLTCAQPSYPMHHIGCQV